MSIARRGVDGVVLLVPDERLAPAHWQRARWVAHSPLELIDLLETNRDTVRIVVIAGAFARDRILLGFLREAYPAIESVVVGEPLPLLAAEAIA